jgi:hypothetical protein
MHPSHEHNRTTLEKHQTILRFFVELLQLTCCASPVISDEIVEDKYDTEDAFLGSVRE